MTESEQTLFDLIDKAYNEDLTNQPQPHKTNLLKAAQQLVDGTDEFNVCLGIYNSYHENYIVPLTLPQENRNLYGYIHQKLIKLDRKRLRDFNLGYGLIASSITFGGFH